MDILIPLDGKPHSAQSVELALSLLSLKGKEILIVTAVDEHDVEEMRDDASGMTESACADISVDSADALIGSISEPLRKAGAAVYAMVERGAAGAVVKAAMVRSGAALTITVPGAHPVSELIKDGSLTQKLLAFDFDGTLILARRGGAGRGPVVFVLSGSDEDDTTLLRLTKFLKYRSGALLVASTVGYSAGGTAALSRTETTMHHSSTDKLRPRLDAASRLLTGASLDHEVLLIDEPLSGWLPGFVTDRKPALVSFSRTQEDVLHRQIGWSAVERLFLDTSCPTALSCTTIKHPDQKARHGPL